MKHFTKLYKKIYVLSTYLYRTFDFMLLWYRVRILELINTLYLPKFQGTISSKKLEIWNLNERNGTGTKNLLVDKRKLNYLAKLSNWLS